MPGVAMAEVSSPTLPRLHQIIKADAVEGVVLLELAEATAGTAKVFGAHSNVIGKNPKS